MLKHIEVDTHTHTVLSGHAWSTLRENARSGSEYGLRGMCLTEHGHKIAGAGPHFLIGAQRMLPPVIEDLVMFYGIEANILDLDAGIDVSAPQLCRSAWTIASMHPESMVPAGEAENTRVYAAVLAHPAVDMLGHIDDIRHPCDFAAVVAEAGRFGKIVEINNNSLNNREGSLPRVERIAGLCAREGVRVAVSSDAHFDTMVGRVSPALELLGRVGFPDELVINRTLEAFQAYQDERRERMRLAFGDAVS